MIDKYLTADIVDNEVLTGDIQENEEVKSQIPEIIAVGNIVIDPTLTIEGQAADAKAVGDRLAILESKVCFTTDETLTLSEKNVLSVNTAKEPDPDNTLPITSAAVAVAIGNIEIILKTI